MDVMVVVVELVLCGVNREPGRGGINKAIDITNYVGLLVGTVVIHDANNNGQDMASVRGYLNNTLDRGRVRGRRRYLQTCRVNW